MIRFPEVQDLSLGPLGQADTGGRGQFRVNAVIPVRLAIGSIDVVLLEIPVGFVTDGGSFPRLLRWKFDPWARFGLAYVFHDAAFYLTDWPKWLVDALFLIALRSRGCSALEASLIYFGVRTRHRRPGDRPTFA